jgi:hypothetical protein
MYIYLMFTGGSVDYINTTIGLSCGEYHVD